MKKPAFIYCDYAVDSCFLVVKGKKGGAMKGCRRRRPHHVAASGLRPTIKVVLRRCRLLQVWMTIRESLQSLPMIGRRNLWCSSSHWGSAASVRVSTCVLEHDGKPAGGRLLGHFIPLHLFTPHPALPSSAFSPIHLCVFPAMSLLTTHWLNNLWSDRHGLCLIQTNWSIWRLSCFGFLLYQQKRIFWPFSLLRNFHDLLIL